MSFSVASPKLYTPLLIAHPQTLLGTNIHMPVCIMRLLMSSSIFSFLYTCLRLKIHCVKSVLFAFLFSFASFFVIISVNIILFRELPQIISKSHFFVEAEFIPNLLNIHRRSNLWKRKKGGVLVGRIQMNITLSMSNYHLKGKQNISESTEHTITKSA